MIYSRKTLNWIANDSAAKTFLVPIKGDNTNDPSETVLLNLLNASLNTTLGNINSATLTIEDAACNGVLPAAITIDTVITEPCVLITVDTKIGVRSPGASALLTISPGVTLVFRNGTGINVQGTGALSALGTPEKPIIFTDEFQSPGSWKGVQFTFNSSNRNELDNVTIEYGGLAQNGNANLILFGAGTKTKLKIRNSTLAHSSRYGFLFNGNSIVSEFSNNTITNNVQSGSLSANSVSMLDAGSRFSGNNIDIVEVTGTAFDTALNPVTTETWPAIDVPYTVGNLSIKKNLIISAGAELRFTSGSGLNVNNTGSLTAIGTPDNKVLFTGVVKTRGHWQGIQFTFNNSTNNILDHVIVEYGGGGSNNGTSNVNAFGNSPNQIAISNSVLRQSAGFGFEFGTATIVNEFSNNIVTSNASGPGKLPATLVDKLKSPNNINNDFTGNDVDVMEVLTTGTGAKISAPLIWPNIGIPYSIGRLDVDSFLTIESGVTLAMRKTEASPIIWVSTSGTLIANGTLADPIVFTSRNALPDQTQLGAMPFPGDWDGILFVNSTNNLIDFATVEYGGATSLGGGANVSAYGASQMSVVNSAINSSSSNGIWVSNTATTNTDITTSNSFLGNANLPVLIAP